MVGGIHLSYRYSEKWMADVFGAYIRTFLCYNQKRRSCKSAEAENGPGFKFQVSRLGSNLHHTTQPYILNALTYWRLL